MTLSLRLRLVLGAVMMMMGAMVAFVYHMVFDQYNLTQMQHVEVISVLLIACTLIAVIAHKIQKIAREDPEGFLAKFEPPEKEEEDERE